MKYINYNHQELELEILKHWEKQKVLEKLKEKNKKGPIFTFLQGPPYTSGKIHLGTAWNTALKDMALRYKRAQGFKVWDRNGYDVHGLPTAHKVMAKHKLKTKEDIENYGLGKFIKECISYSLETGAQMAKEFKRIGVTLDYTDSYMALQNEYMEGEWWMIKKAWQKKRLYQGDKAMTWCANCETALAKHECEYKEIKEDSIFLKFPVKGKKKEFLIIWTTTPWTIPFNLGIMVNPNLDYVKVKVDDEKWIVGKGLAGPFIQSLLNKKLKIIEEFKGEQLKGVEYVHPLADKVPQFKELKKEFPNVHTVVMSEQFVDFSAGTGLVHLAPGCGPEDYEVGREYKIPPFNTLNEKGEFTETTPAYENRVAKKDDQKFIKDFKEATFLITTSKVEHDYPHCWRCHQGVVFKTTKQWFFKIEDLRAKMIKENQKVNWVPKTQAFDSWTDHLKDNSITRQRYWGTPVPIWRCDKCDNVEVIGSIKELKEKGGRVPKDIHRPWIDEIKWDCKCDQGKMERIPDILDVWIDAGTASWNCLYYPAREDDFKGHYPADLILEATEQVRLWFSMLSICSQLSMGNNCYKNVYMHGMLRGIDGQKMSKSLGNIISPDEMVERYGADVLRYYMCQTNAGQDIKFSWDEAALKKRFLQILWNVHKLLINLARENKVNPSKLKVDLKDVEEKYIISKLNSTIEKVTSLFDAYRLDETIAPLEELFLELSRTYIQMVRDKSSLGSKKEKEECVQTIYTVLFDCLKMFNIIAPFISEAIYLNMKDEFKLKEESISHCSWPQVNQKERDAKLEKEMEIVKNVIQSILHAREKAHLGLRWPVKEAVIVTKDKEVVKAVENLNGIVAKQTNAKLIKVEKSLAGVKTKIKADFAKIGPAYGKLSSQIVAKLSMDSPETILAHLEKENRYQFKIEDKEIIITREMLLFENEVPENYQEVGFKQGFVYLNKERNEELEVEGYAREVMRNVQILRKKAGLEKKDEIKLFIKVSKEMAGMLNSYGKEIAEKVGAKEMKISLTDSTKKLQEEFKVKKEKFKVWFEKSS